MDAFSITPELIYYILYGITAVFALCKGLGRLDRSKIPFISKSKIAKDDTCLPKLSQDQLKERMQLATDAMQVLSQFVKAITIVRSPIIHKQEYEELKSLPLTHPIIAKMKEKPEAGVILLRLDKKASMLSELMKLRPRFRNYFGTDEAIINCERIWNEILNTAKEFVNGATDEEQLKLLWRDVGTDALDSELQSIIQNIEARCNPILELYYKTY